MDQGDVGASALMGILAGLALVDSTSFGTLLIPVWLLITPGPLRAGRVLVYLSVVAGAYALIGGVLLASLVLFGEELIGWLGAVRQSQVALTFQAILAVGLVWVSLRLDPVTEVGKARKRRRAAQRGDGTRVAQLRHRAVGDGSQGGTAQLFGLAVAAVGLEFATLIPYLSGIGLIASVSPQLPVSALMILFYCAVMITPALVLLVGRVTARRWLEIPLSRLEGFLSRHTHGTVALILFLLGLLLGLNALDGLQEAGVL